MNRLSGGHAGGLEYRRAFVAAATELGRTPEVYYGRMPSTFRPLDAANQLATAARLAPRLRRARSVWVVTTAASYGFAASLSSRPYSCWIATGLADEWAGRRLGLPRSRRLAIRVNAPILTRLERSVLRGAGRVYGISPWSRASVARAGGLAEERVGILPIPIDLETFTPASDEEWRGGRAVPSPTGWRRQASSSRSPLTCGGRRSRSCPRARRPSGSRPPRRWPQACRW